MTMVENNKMIVAFKSLTIACYRAVLFFLCLFIHTYIFAQNKVKIDKYNSGYTFNVNGKEYYVKGVGGEVNLDYAVKIGANSIRTWGIDNAQKVLDEAQKKGLTVMLGFWLQHERHGFDYNDKDKVDKQTNHFKSIVDKYKNHPALLMWGIGNELNLQYSNPKCWDAVQDLAKYIHQTDPNHPTSTVTAGLDSVVLHEISTRIPDLDVYCINTYGDIAHAVNKVQAYGWNGPYMITEWGVNGYWESPKTAWDVSIEQSSTEKRNVFYDRYTQYILPQKNCLGSYAFLWGEKQEYTETWFGLFSKNNEATEPINALEMGFNNSKNINLKFPTVASFTLNNRIAKDNIYLNIGDKNTAQVIANIGFSENGFFIDSTNSIKYTWKILAESTDKKSGGDQEEEAKEIFGLIKQKNKNQITFKTPNTKGAYRLFITAKYNNQVAYANIPFYVNENKSDKQSNFIQFKKTNINDFN